EVPYQVCSGQQESGSVCITSRGPSGRIGASDWQPVGIIEYGYAAPDPANPDVIYGAGRNKVTRYVRSTGQVQDVSPIPIRGTHRVERTQPIAFSPIQANLLYYAANVLFRSTNGGRSWQTISPDLSHPRPGVPPKLGSLAAKDKDAGDRRGAIYALAPSYKSTSTIWAGTDDGKLWVTRDAGKHWTDITPAQVTPWSKITQLDASRFDDTTVYASVSRLRVDDLAPYIYRTHDGGKTWTAITTGLPPGPVDAVRADPVRRGLLYASTETGVWMSFDDGDHWQTLQLNLPHTSVRDIVVHDRDLIAATHGRAFWILDDLTPLRQVAATMADTLIKPAPAYRLPRSTGTDTPVPIDEPAAENPPNGAVIDYYLATAVTGVVTLEIVDPKGDVVRRFASSDPPELTDEELAKQLIPAAWVQPRVKLATTPGMHRWVWDLRRARPLANGYGYPISAAPHATPRRPEGPRVAPATYTVRLVANGKTLTAPLVVKLDPRSKLSASDVAQQNALETRLAAALTRGSAALLEARALAEQLEKLAANPRAKAAIDGLAPKVTAILAGPKQAPVHGEAAPTLGGVTGKLGGLYAALDVDAPPTAVVTTEAAKAERELATISKAWAAIVATDLVRANAALTAAGLPVIKPDQRPEIQEGSGDEE
ncbi:MAG: glycoside hydrolase, partial [Kofleriaceae bacterium]